MSTTSSSLTPRRQRTIAIVEPADSSWQPRDWDDFPQSGEVLSLVRARSRSHAEGLLYLFNSRRLKSPGDRMWAVLIQPGAEVCRGSTCYRRVVAFDNG